MSNTKTRKPCSNGKMDQNRGFMDKSSNNKPTVNTGRQYSNTKPERNNKRFSNDYTWYYIDDRISASVANIPFNIFPGTREDTGLNCINGVATSTPGIMEIEYGRICGTSLDSTSAINVACRALYTFVRHQNSGHTNYESPDLMIYVLAMQDVYAKYFEAVRIYKTAMTYTFTNRYVPDGLLRAMRVDPNNIRSNLAQYRAGLNILAAKISSMAVPSVFTAVQRAVYLSSNVFIDSSSIRGQFYVPTCVYKRIFDATADKGGRLHCTGRIGKSRTYTEVLEEIQSMIDIILSDEDMNIMSGDILKAYSKEQCYTLDMVNESETLTPIYDENFLAQLENSSSVALTAADFTIYQEDGVILSTPHVDIDELPQNVFYGPGVQRYFNSHKDNPDWKDVLDWSRFMVSFELDDAGDGYRYLSVGSEVIVAYTIHYLNYESDASSGTWQFREINTISSWDGGDSAETLEHISDQILLSQFDWHPIIYYFMSTTDPALGTIHQYVGKTGDLKVYTLVNSDVIKRLNDSAILGLYGKQLTLFLK